MSNRFFTTQSLYKFLLATFVIASFFVVTSNVTISQETATVDATTHSAFIPAGLTEGGTFRLLFLTSTTHDEGVNAKTIAQANNHAQDRAAASSITALQSFSSQFRALVSTADTNAIDNTETNTDDTDAAIYWLTGEKVAENYAGFYDSNGWLSRVGKDESGNNITSGVIHTGSTVDGTVDNSLGIDNNDTTYGNLGVAGSEIDAGASNVATPQRFYAISPLFTIGTVTSTNSAPTINEIALGIESEPERDQVITITDSDTGDTVTAHWGYVDASASCNDTNFSTGGTEISLTGDNSAKTGTITYSGVDNNTKYICVRAYDETDTTYLASTNSIINLTLPLTADIDITTYAAIIPTELNSGDTFRLIFVTSTAYSEGGSTKTTAQANTHAQNRAADSTITILQSFSSQFRALVSTATLDARDNTETNTETETDTDAPIYWLTGDKVAVDYRNFYDSNGWDSRAGKNENGADFTPTQIYTGSTFDGTVKNDLGIDDNVTNFGVLTSAGSEIDSGATQAAVEHHIYAISPVFTITGTAVVSDETAPTATSALTCNDCQNDLANATDVITYTFTFNENVTVPNTATVTDNLGNTYDIQGTPTGTTSVVASHTVTSSSSEGDVTTLTVTNITDTAGNAFASSHTIASDDQVGIDRTAPTATLVTSPDGAGIVITPSEDIIEETAVVTTDFTTSANSIASISKSSEVERIILWMENHIVAADSLTVTYSGTGFTDLAGNVLVISNASVTVTIISSTISINTVSPDGYVNAAESNPVVPISGTTTNVSNGQTISLTISDTDSNTADLVNADLTTLPTVTAVVGEPNNGTWLTNIPLVEMQKLAEGEITITATYITNTGVTQTFTYDRTAPTSTSITTSTDGESIVISLGESVTGTTVIGDWAVTGNTIDAATLTDSTTITLEVGTTITNTDTLALTYSGTLLIDTAGNALAISNATVTNAVTVSAVAPDFGYAYAGIVAVNHFLEINSDSTNITISDEDFFGSAIANLGDLDGSGAGVTTIAVGAVGEKLGGTYSKGAVHLINLKEDGTVLGTPVVIDNNHPKITADDDDDFGSAIANLGDLDIGLSDTDATNSKVTIAVGLSGDDVAGADGGQDFAGEAGAINLINLNSSGAIVGNVVKIGGTTQGILLEQKGYFGSSIADLGDLDGNRAGVTTIAVGADGGLKGEAEAAGAIYLINLTSAGGIEGTSLKIKNGSAGITLADRDNFGSSIANLGDLDGTGDGLTTIAVGAKGSNTNEGAVYLINLSSEDTIEGNAVKIDNDSTNITIGSNSGFGSSIVNLGDLDGTEEGVTTIAVGASLSPQVFIINLNSSGGIVETAGVINNASLSATITTTGASRSFGSSIVSLGDLDGDGIDEIVIGEALEGAGSVHIISFTNKQYSFTAGDTVNITLPAAETGSPTITYALSPTYLPTGLEFSDTARTITGTLTGTLAATEYTLTADNSVSPADTFAFNLGVSEPPTTDSAPDFGYVDAGIIAVNHFLEINYNSTGITILDDVDFGYSIADLGDLDGTGAGVTTVAVGARRDNTGGTYAGAVHIINLNADGTILGTVVLDNDNSKITLASYDEFGTSVANLGDLDGAGAGAVTIAVGAINDDAGVSDSEKGAVYIINLTSAGVIEGTPVKITDGSVGTDGSTERITLLEDYSFGRSVVSLGDLDGEGAGVTTLAVGTSASGPNSNYEGAVYLINLNSAGVIVGQPVVIDNSNPKITLGEQEFGLSIANLGDLDGEGAGVRTIAVGSLGAPTTNKGSVHIINLDSSGGIVGTPVIIDDNNSKITVDDNDRFGISLANLGDLDGNGTGVATIAVGVDNVEKVYIINLDSAGAIVGTPGIINNASLSATLQDGDYFGGSIVSLGDINGDGINEIIIGERWEGPGTSRSGAVHIISFANKEYSFTTGDTVNITLPAAEIGSPAPTYSISPTYLPTGLEFSDTARTITGTPTDTQTKTEYTLTADNSVSPDATFAFNLGVSAPPVTNNAPVISTITLVADTATSRVQRITVTDQDDGDTLSVEWKYVDTSAECVAAAFSTAGTTLTLSSDANSSGRTADIVYYGTDNNGKWICVEVNDGTVDVYGVSDTAIANLEAIVNNAETATVNPTNHGDIIPSGLNVGDKFRLLFVASTPLDKSTNIYTIAQANTHIQDRVAASTFTPALTDFSPQFRALVSTADTDARDNTGTNSTETGADIDAPIYWFKGAKAADDYADFYDSNGWDSNTGRDESGVVSNLTSIHTGTLFNGTVSPGNGIDANNTTVGSLTQDAGNEIDRGDTSAGQGFRLYGLSPVFTIVANSNPTDITLTLSNDPVNENQTAVGTFSTTDDDDSDSHIYDLVDGTGNEDNGKFALDENTGVITFTSAPDFEAPDDLGDTANNNTYSIRVQTSDGAATFEKEFIITVEDVVEQATFIIDTITAVSINEGAAYTSVTPSLSGDTPIGTVTYTKSGTDSDDFTIDATTGVVSMVARDYESPEDADTNNDYEITITATDEDGNTDEESWTVSVTDNPELGGVSTGISLWVKANEGIAVNSSNVITSWLDQSLSAISGTSAGSPVLSSSLINFNPSVLFDGSNDHFAFSAPSTIKNRDNFTFIAVAGSNDISTNAFQHILGTDRETGVRIPFRGGNIGLHRTNAGDFILDKDPPVAANDIGIVAVRRSGTNGDDFATYQDGAEHTVSSANTNRTFDENTTITYLGRESRSNQPTRLNGQIAELVVFEDALSTADLDKVMTNLAIKYGITLDSAVVNYVNSDGTAVFANSGTYANDIVGIAKDDASVLDQRISKSKNEGAILTISTDSTFTGASSGHANSLTDGQYLIVGNDDGGIVTQETELPSGISDENRIIREWKVQNTGNVGEVNLKFDGLDSTYTLYTDADGDFSSGTQTSAGALSADGGIATTLPSGTSYFTLTTSTVVNNDPSVISPIILATDVEITRDQVITITDTDSENVLTVHWEYVDTSVACASTAFSASSEVLTLSGTPSDNPDGRETTITYSGPENNTKFICVRVFDEINTVYGVSTAAIVNLVNTEIAIIDPTTHASFIPSGFVFGDKFRLFFITGQSLNGNSRRSVAEANTHVQNQANGSSITALQGFSSQFRALVSAVGTDARDNTGTNTVTATDFDSPIYWVGGEKVADDYVDFYDHTWDSTALKNQHGGDVSRTDATRRPSTGSERDGTLDSGVGIDSVNTREGRPDFGGREIWSGSSNDANMHFYAISPVFVIDSQTNAEISDLDVSVGTVSPVFDKDTTAYTLNVGNAESITITPKTAPSASITITGTAADGSTALTVTPDTSTLDNVISGLTDGNNTVTMVVTSGDTNTTETYTITVARGTAANNLPTDITLALTNDPVNENQTVVGTFTTTDANSDTHLYTLETGTGSEDNGEFTLDRDTGVIAFSDEPDHEIPEDSDGNNRYSIRVQTDDQNGGIFQKVLTITVTDVAEDDADIESLAITNATLNETFAPGDTTYTATVLNSVTSVTITPTVSHPEAVVAYTFNTAQATNTITLADGTNTIEVIVTAEDGTTTKTYTITIERATAIPTVTIDTILIGDYLDAEEDNSDIVISGASTDIANTNTITLEIADSDTTEDVDITASPAVGNDGTWSTTIGATDIQGLAEGQITVTASYSRATDATRTFTYDRTAPTAPAIGVISTPSGSSILVALSEQVIDSGTLSASDFQITVSTISAATLDVSGSTINIILGTPLVHGDTPSITYSGTTLADAAGNTLVISSVAVTNSVPAPVPTITITTPISTDGYVNLAESIDSDGLTITGTSTNIPLNDNVELALTGVANPISGAVNADGTWDVNIPASAFIGLTEGTITATPTHTESSTELTAVTFVLDITPPSNPIISLAEDTGSAADDGITSDATVNVTNLDGGTTTWEWDVDDGRQNPTPTPGVGASFEILLNQGPFDYVVTQRDVAGNTASATAQYEHDNTAPATPTFALREDTGSSNTDGITSNGIVDVSGLEGGTTTWEWYEDSDDYTDGTGTSFTISPGTSGEYTVRQTDAAGNVSNQLTTETFIIDDSAPTLSTPIPNQTATVGTSFTYAVPSTTFREFGSPPLTYTSSGHGTELTFTTDTWTGTPTTATTLTVTVTATDVAGNEKENIFDIVIAASGGGGGGGDSTAPTVTGIQTSSPTTITIDLDEAVSGTVAASEFTVSANTVAGAALTTTTQITLTVGTAIVFGATPTVTYTGTSLDDAAGNTLATFTNESITNNVPAPSPTGTITSYTITEDGSQESTGTRNNYYRNQLEHLNGNYYVATFDRLLSATNTASTWQGFLQLYEVRSDGTPRRTGNAFPLEGSSSTRNNTSAPGASRNDETPPLKQPVVKLDNSTVAVAFSLERQAYIGLYKVDPDGSEEIALATTTEGGSTPVRVKYDDGGATVNDGPVNASLIVLDEDVSSGARRLALVYQERGSSSNSNPESYLQLFTVNADRTSITTTGTRTLVAGNQGRMPSVVRLKSSDATNHTLAVAYRNGSADGKLRLITVDSSNNVSLLGTANVGNTDNAFSFETGRSSDHQLLRVDDDTLALAYADTTAGSEEGILVTFDVSSSNVITKNTETVYDTEVTAAAIEPHTYLHSFALIDDTNDLYAIAYRGLTGQGFVKLYELNSSDVFVERGSLQHETGYGSFNSLARIADDKFILVFGAGVPATVGPAPNFPNDNSKIKTFSFAAPTNNNPTDITLVLTNDPVNENQTAVGTFSTEDDDDSDSHTYTLVAGTGDEDNGDFTLVESTGVITFTTAPDHEDPDDSDTDNIYNIRVQTSDGTATFSKAFTITVADVAENDVNLSGLEVAEATISPAFNPTTLAYTSNVASTVATVSVTPTVSHPDATVTVGGVAATSGSASTVALSDGANAINIVVRAENTALTKTYTLNISRGAATNTPPSNIAFTDNPTQTILENTTRVGALEATDPDVSDVHIFTIVTSGFGPDGDKFTLTPEGVLSFKAANTPDFENPTDVGDTAGNNTYSVLIQVDDQNGGTFSLAFQIIVTDVDEIAPAVDNPIGNQDAIEGTLFTFQFADDVFSDANTPITYTSNASSISWLSFVPATRTFTGTPGASDVGSETIIVTAADPAGNTATDEFDITISAAGAVESDDTTLSVLSLSDSAPLSPTFDSAVDTYYTTVGNSSTITVTATPNDSNASVSFAGTQTDGSTLLTISSVGAVTGLTNGTNKVTITVTAEDNSTDTYTLKIYKTGISFVDKIINGYTDGISLTSNADFGRSVANLGDLKIGLTEAADIAAAVRTIAVGASRDDTGGDNGNLSDRGAIYIINLDANGEIVGSQIKYDSSHSSFSGLLANESLLGLVIAGLGDLDGAGAGEVTLAARISSGSSGAVIRLINIGSDGSIEGISTIDRTTQGIASFADIGASIADLGDLDIGNLTEEQETNSVKTLAIGDISTGVGRGSIYLVNIDSSGAVVGPAVAIGSGQITLLAEDAFGRSVANLGDLDLGLSGNDATNSIATIAVGARNSGLSRSNLDKSGFLYLININSAGGIVGSPKIIIGHTGAGVPAGDNFPISLTSLGDLDAGLSESDAENSILTIASGADSFSVSGVTDGGTVVLINIDENGDLITHSDGSTRVGISAIDDRFTLSETDRFGISTANLGDLDGNGTSILVVGAYGSDMEGENKGAVHIVRVGTPTYSYTTGDTVSITLPAVLTGASDATYLISSSSPDLPAGLGFTAATRTITGIVTAATQGSTEYILTATNSEGETAEYAFNIDVVLNNSSLSGLTISPGTLSPAFAITETNFTSNIPSSESSVTLTPTLTDSTANIDITGTAADTTTSLSVSGTRVSGLTVGDNVITIVVTSADGVNSTTYTITVIRAPIPTVAIDTIPTGDYVNATEDNSDIIISGTSTNIANTQTITFEIADSDTSVGTDIARIPVVGSDGTWSTTLTPSNIQGLAEGTVTVTVSYTGATPVTQTFIYDKTLPEITVVRVAGTDNADATSDRKYIAVVADTNPHDTSTLSTAYRVHTSGTCQSAVPTEASSQDFATEYPTGASTGQYCYYVTDRAGNVGTETTTNAIEGVGNLQVQDSTKEGTTYYVSSGTKELTGVTAAGAKVFIEIADSVPADATTATYTQTLGATDSAISIQTSFSPSNNGQKIYAWIQTNPSDTATLTPPIEVGTITIDDVAPTIGTISGYSGNRRIWNTGNPTFAFSTLSEPIVEIDVTLGDLIGTCFYDISLTTCVGSPGVSTSNVEGPVRLTGTIKDRAGNILTIDEETPYIFDTTSPTVSITSSKPTLINQSTATLTITVSDDYGLDAGTHTFTVSGGTGTCTLNTINTPDGQLGVATSTCEITVTGADGGEVTLTPSATISDRAHSDGQTGQGNIASTTPIVVHRVDTSAPTIDSIEEFDVSNRRRPETNILVTHNQVAANNVLPESLTAAFEGECSSFPDIQVTSATPTPTTSTRYSLVVVSPSAGTYSDCSVKLTDEAGNESNSIDIAEFTVRRSSGGSGGTLFLSGGGIGNIAPVVPDQYGTEETTEEVQASLPTTAPVVERHLNLQFKRDLSIETSGDDVKELQEFLNNNGFPVSNSGAGSKGQETDYFGPATQKALAEYQETNDIPATGYLGEQTRQSIQKSIVINEIVRNIIEIQNRIKELQEREASAAIPEQTQEPSNYYNNIILNTIPTAPTDQRALNAPTIDYFAQPQQNREEVEPQEEEEEEEDNSPTQNGDFYNMFFIQHEAERSFRSHLSAPDLNDFYQQ